VSAESTVDRGPNRDEHWLERRALADWQRTCSCWGDRSWGRITSGGWRWFEIDLVYQWHGRRQGFDPLSPADSRDAL